MAFNFDFGSAAPHGLLLATLAVGFVFLEARCTKQHEIKLSAGKTCNQEVWLQGTEEAAVEHNILQKTSFYVSTKRTV